MKLASDGYVEECLKRKINFAVVAGAGSGKTTSLVKALDYLRNQNGDLFMRSGQKVVCITYTNRAVGVIEERLGHDELFVVSTIHGFLWGLVRTFPYEIGKVIINDLLPALVEKNSEKIEKVEGRLFEIKEKTDSSEIQISACESELEKLYFKKKKYETLFENLSTRNDFQYIDSRYSNFENGEIGHDDLVKIASAVLSSNDVFRVLLGQMYPYIFIDEAQDSFDSVLSCFYWLCEDENGPVLGLFGDPVQQIYDNSSQTFVRKDVVREIKKEENFRCSERVIKFLNCFRTDIKQKPAGANQTIAGTVSCILVPVEPGKGNRKRYSDDQLIENDEKYTMALETWRWTESADSVVLFLSRQMIARKAGFSNLNLLFSGSTASERDKDLFNKGEHYLLKPFVGFIYPLLAYLEQDEFSNAFELCSQWSPRIKELIQEARAPVGVVVKEVTEIMRRIETLWQRGSIDDIYSYCLENRVVPNDRKLQEGLCDFVLYKKDVQLLLEENAIEVEEEAAAVKEKTLSVGFFNIDKEELRAYARFLVQNTPYSTQHGVKGEEYRDVLVVYDDLEARWNQYSFSKLFAPKIYGKPTKNQEKNSFNLSYVAFSRAKVNLKILMFVSDAEGMAKALTENGLFRKDEVQILEKHD